MLVLSRKIDEDIVIGDGVITVKVLSIKGDKVRLGVDAPRELGVNRGEIYDRIIAEQGEKPAA